jgi:uncharacterized protein (TIGR00251 family)
MSPFVKAHRDGALLSLKIIPRASRNEIAEALGNELKVKVTAPPVDSAANRAVVELIADVLNISKANVALVRGETSRHKLILIKGLSPERVESALMR